MRRRRSRRWRVRSRRGQAVEAGRRDLAKRPADDPPPGGAAGEADAHRAQPTAPGGDGKAERQPAVGVVCDDDLIDRGGGAERGAGVGCAHDRKPRRARGPSASPPARVGNCAPNVPAAGYPNRRAHERGCSSHRQPLGANMTRLTAGIAFTVRHGLRRTFIATAMLTALAGAQLAGGAQAATPSPTVHTGGCTADRLRLGDADRTHRTARQQHLLLLPVRPDDRLWPAERRGRRRRERHQPERERGDLGARAGDDLPLPLDRGECQRRERPAATGPS